MYYFFLLLRKLKLIFLNAPSVNLVEKDIFLFLFNRDSNIILVIKIAVNNELTDYLDPNNLNAEIALLPPFAGG